jgi:monoamine oxidase
VLQQRLMLMNRRRGPKPVYLPLTRPPSDCCDSSQHARLEKLMPTPTNRVVIVGAGAAGVFTAYRLREMYGDKYEIVLLEANGRVGGNCFSTHVEYGGKDYSIDCGAQFFYKNPQPSYVALLDQLGLLDSAQEVIAAPAGFTVYDKPAGELRLWLPSRVVEFLGYDAADWERLVKFLEYLAYSAVSTATRPTTGACRRLSAGLTLIDDDFKENVLKPLHVSFVSLPRS